MAKRAKKGIDCAESLDITVVADLYREFQDNLAQGKPVTVDLGKVNRIDTAAVQLLVAFAGEAVTKNIAISWKDTPEAVVDAFRVLGMESSGLV